MKLRGKWVVTLLALCAAVLSSGGCGQPEMWVREWQGDGETKLRYTDYWEDAPSGLREEMAAQGMPDLWRSTDAEEREDAPVPISKNDVFSHCRMRNATFEVRYGFKRPEDGVGQLWLEATDRRTGQLVLEIAPKPLSGGAMRSAWSRPRLRGNRLLVCGTGFQLYDLTGRKRLWQVPPSALPKGDDCTVVFVGNAIYATFTCQTPDARFIDVIQVRSAADGKLLVEFPDDENPLGRLVQDKPVRKGETLHFLFKEGWRTRDTLQVRRPSDGQLLWQLTREDLDGSVRESKLVGGHLLLGVKAVDADRGWVGAFDPASGRRIWRKACAMPPVAITPLDDKRILVQSTAFEDVSHLLASVTSHPSAVTCLQLKTGRQLWQFSADRACGSAPALRGRLLFVETDGQIYALDPATGKELWKTMPFPGGTFSDSSYWVHENRLYVVGQTWGIKGGLLLHILFPRHDVDRWSRNWIRCYDISRGLSTTGSSSPGRRSIPTAFWNIWPSRTRARREPCTA